ncbi:ABC transporter ATP-binding protein/permease [Eubacteriales bacterium OttesenSCG-928-G02]|nr:ABC transporter ATP-binding protein/permease [Eubacteriales bacterium OttesenSCG-928-G02]
MNNFIRLYKYIDKNKPTLIAIIGCVIISNISLLFTPLLIGKAVNYMINMDKDWFYNLIIILIVISFLYIISMLLSLFAQRLASKVSVEITNNLRVKAFNKLQRLPINYFDKKPTGEIMSRLINDIEQIDDALAQSFIQLISGITTIILTMLFMFYLNAFVAVIAVFVTPLCFLIGFFITKYSRKKFVAQSNIVGDIDGYIEEIFSQQHTVKAFNYENNSMEHFEKLNEKLYKEGWQAQFGSALVNPSTRFVNNTTYVLVGIFSIISVLNGTLSPGNIASFLTYTNYFSKPINEISSTTMQLQLASVSAGRVFEILDTPDEIDGDTLLTAPLCGNTIFKNVDFSYDKKNKLIENFNLNIKSGQKIAIVGKTGSGKTTLVNLLMRFYELDRGNIYIDEINIKDIAKESLRKNIGMVLQDTWLFSGTIKENIAYGKPNATQNEIINAAKAAYAHNFITRLEHNYNTVIEQNGVNLSKGEQQLLAIARVMLLDTPIIILDEASSNVDILTEKRIQKAFDELMKGKTSFVIAHRLSTIKNSDVILVLDKGNIIEQGSHDELIKMKGLYSELYNSFE